MEPTSQFQTSGLKKAGVPQKHNILLIVLIFVNVVAFIVTIFFNAASSLPSIKIFKSVTGNISDRHPVDITPAGWTFSTWGIIYTWQGLWLLFNVVIIFIKNANGDGYLYQTPLVLSPVVHLIYLSNLGFNIAWLFLFDSELFSVGFGVLVLIVITLYIPIILTHKSTYEAIPYLNRNQACLWAYRILVLNGLPFYATWVTIASSLNFSIAMTYEWQTQIPRDTQTSGYIALAAVTLILIIYFALDLYIFEKYLRYTYSVYLQLFIAFAGVLSKHWAARKGTAIFVLVLLIFSAVVFLVKIVLSIIRAAKGRSRSKVLS